MTRIYANGYIPSGIKKIFNTVSTTNWVEIDKATDAQYVFDLFNLDKRIELYSTNFSKIRIKQKQQKSWLSEGLKNTLRYKNKFCVRSKNIKSTFNEGLYRICKPKLQEPMKVAENFTIMIC